MSHQDLPTPEPDGSETGTEYRVHRAFVTILLVVMVAELIFLVMESLWLSSYLVLMIIIVTAFPFFFRKHMPVDLPSEFHMLAIVFIFASLFLGEIQDFYQRLWWWDIALHGTSGLLMGILGFLLVYLLNESKRVDLYMQPRFVALFAFVFAVAIGTIWEIFEFAMDQTVGSNMQKPMFGDVSGLTDTMWDMIVNALGALFISLFSLGYMKRHEGFFVNDWIRKFIEKNPDRFRD